MFHIGLKQNRFIPFTTLSKERRVFYSIVFKGINRHQKCTLIILGNQFNSYTDLCDGQKTLLNSSHMAFLFAERKVAKCLMVSLTSLSS